VSVPSPTPGALFEATARQWREEFVNGGFSAVCPVSASVVGCSASNVTVRTAASAAFILWQSAAAAALSAMRVPEPRAKSLATLMISALEGAILIARAERDVRALDVVVGELRPLLDGATR
jgi:hypothetical protein